MIMYLTRLSPEEPSAGEASGQPLSPPPAPEPGAAAATDLPQQETAEPSGQQVSHEEFARLTRADAKAREHDQQFTQFQKLGYDSHAAAMSALEQYGKMRSDPQTKGIMEAMSAPAPAPQADTPAGDLTQDNIAAIVTQQMDQRDAQHFQTTYAEAQVSEQTIISQAFEGEAVKKHFGDLSYADLVGGQGDEAQKAKFVLLDTFLAEAQSQRNGQPFPLQDPALVTQAFAKVNTALKALAAAGILEGSSDPARTGLAQPNDLPGVQATPADDYSSPLDRTRKQNQEVDDSFWKSQEAIEKAERGTPASQI